jgi:3-oxoacyl-ACP reductase-like protein
MSRTRLAMAAAVVAAAVSTAAPAPAGAAQDPPYCDPGPCITYVIQQKVADTTEEVIWAVRCIGDSLGGNSCHQ